MQKRKLGILNFTAAAGMDPNEALLLYLVAAADPQDPVSRYFCAVLGWNELHAVLCYAVLRCAVLCCALLCCALLCCALLYCALLCCAGLCCAVLCCAVLCPAVLCCAVLCCAALCCVIWLPLTTRQN